MLNAVNTESYEEYSGTRTTKITFLPRLNEDYITKFSEEIEKKGKKKSSENLVKQRTEY